MTHQGNAAVHQHPPAVEYSRTRRSLSAATGRLSVSAILTIARSYRQPPLPRRTKKRPGDRPGRRGCRYSQQPTPNRMHRFVRIALQSKSRIQNMGNLLLWIRLARTGPMISGLLLFCIHRNFHFLFQMAHCLSFPVSCRDTPQKVPQTEKKPLSSGQRLFSGDPYGTRTHVTAVKGRCLNHLTNGPFW